MKFVMNAIKQMNNRNISHEEKNYS